jgi:ubiquinone biosynthesis protein UbiJ
MSATDTSGSLDPTYIQALIATIETSINAALRYDPASQQKIAALNDILAIESTLPHLCLYIHGQADGIRVQAYCEAPVSTHITGSPLALLSLLKQPTTLANSGVTLAGSTALLQQWQTILQSLDIDWEDAISQVLGDIAGPISAKGMRNTARYVKEQAREHARLMAEYLPEEINMTPSKPEVNAFLDQVDDLTLNVDRIRARIQALQNALREKTESGNAP